MPEPTSTAVTTAVVAAPVLALAGVSLGIRADELIAGFAGAIAGIALLDTVPRSDDSAMELVRSTVKRAFVAITGALTAAYLGPLGLAAVPGNEATGVELGVCFVIGLAAQRVLRALADRAEKLARG